MQATTKLTDYRWEIPLLAAAVYSITRGERCVSIRGAPDSESGRIWPDYPAHFEIRPDVGFESKSGRICRISDLNVFQL